MIEAAAGQRLGEAHELAGGSALTGWTSGPVSGKSWASTSRNNIEPGIRSAFGSFCASASVSWQRVRQTRPVFGSRYRQRQHSTSFVTGSMLDHHRHDR